MVEFGGVFVREVRDVLYQFEYMVWFAILALFWDNVPAMILIYAALFLFHALIAVLALVLKNRTISSRELVQHFFIRDISPSAGESTIGRTLILTIMNRVLIFTATAYVIWYVLAYL